MHVMLLCYAASVHLAHDAGFCLQHRNSVSEGSAVAYQKGLTQSHAHSNVLFYCLQAWLLLATVEHAAFQLL